MKILYIIIEGVGLIWNIFSHPTPDISQTHPTPEISHPITTPEISHPTTNHPKPTYTHSYKTSTLTIAK
jgi:hypothetical protein